MADADPISSPPATVRELNVAANAAAAAAASFSWFTCEGLRVVTLSGFSFVGSDRSASKFCARMRAEREAI